MREEDLGADMREEDLGADMSEEDAWKCFLGSVRSLSKATYSNRVMNPAQLGQSLYSLRRGELPSQSEVVNTAAVAYEIQIQEQRFRAAAKALELTLPPDDVFEVLLLSEFGMRKFHLTTDSYEVLNSYFLLWLRAASEVER